MKTVKIFRSMAHLERIDIFIRDSRTEGPPILCLHGRWGRGETWVDFIRHYGHAYRVIAPDQRGHGLSGKAESDYTAEEMAEDMVSLMRFLRIDSAVVVGHSMGGGIAGYLAAIYPERVKGLAILDKSASGPAKSDLPPEGSEGVDPVTKDWPLPFTSRQEAQETIKKDMGSDLGLQYFMDSLIETEEGYRMMFSSKAMAANIAHYREWYGLLPRIRCPVLLLRAKGGEAVPDEDFARMKSLIPDCLAFEMTKPDHNVHLSNPEEFYRYFDEFLARVEF